ncbi:adenylate/guanylate cyclase domain-containing protein [Algoriphagus halophilus]|uniref:Serine/threonine protein kinase n=1 Tax=Algoriphagus halophilus TaxID=226505 RepID=A0A1N6G683_9BACT|nr:adenylate/guanylate cyclase domain-containing protein [Algoriphagus halophilus]SIO03056.1 serine/threonine protein kinase [Algoriphagus halophilus]
MPDFRFDILDKVRENSRYIVYKANRIQDSKPVTIQTFRSAYPSFRDLNHLKQEYSILSKLSHPNIVQPIGLEYLENLPILVNEDVIGEPLSEHLKKGNLDLIIFLKIAMEITKAVNYLHSKNIIHKNINPSNIIVNKNGEIKVWGFDYAIERGRDLNFSNVSEALELGLHYISPEQTGRMNRPIDHRTDLYSIGAVFYEMLTGKTIFNFSDPMELMHAHLALLPEEPSKLRHDIPQVISKVVLKLLKKNTSERYQSCSGLLNDLQQCLDRLLDINEITEFTLGTQDRLDQFQISSKIYGRDEELKQMNEVFQRIKNKRAELALVSGYSGVGKSSFVREFQKYIDLGGGFFISGKFEQYKNNPPLSSLLIALNDLIDQILIRGEEQQDYWRKSILKAVGNSGQLIIDIMPDLELLIGPQTEVPQLPMNESKNRFDQVFNSFIRSFASEDHPLCIFLDDLQWLDSTTRRWLENTLMDPSLKHLLVICAYRENEVSPSHPMMLMLDRLSSHGVTTTQFALSPLDQNSVEEIIADSLSISKESGKDLAQIVYRKTLGNPFFIRQCLLTLYESGVIQVSQNTQSWTYSIEKANRVSISDNVIDLMSELFFRLPDEVQTTLKYASCIGNTFSIEILSGLVDISEGELDMQLKFAEKLCIIENIKTKERSGDDDYGFQHDKIQQAALGLLSETEKRKVRLEIAKSIISKLSDIEHSDYVYIVTDHLNYAQELILDQDLLKKLVELNISASIRAKYANAYESGLSYIKNAMELVQSKNLNVSKETLRDLNLQRAESEHLAGNNSFVVDYFDEALNYAEDVIDKAKITIRKIQFYNNTRNFEAAYQVCREVTSELGVSIPASFSPPSLAIEFVKYKAMMGKRDVEELINLPEMSDEKLKTAILLMAAAGQSAFQIKPELCVLVCAIMVNLCLKHGNTDGGFIGFLGFGPVFHSGILGFRTTGYKIGQLTLGLVDKYQNYGARAEVNFVTGYFAIPWKKPAKEMEGYWLNAYEAGLEVGDLFHASCASCAMVQSYFMRGVQYDLVLESCNSYLDFLKRFQIEEGIFTMSAISQSIKNLQGKTNSIDSFSDEIFNENEYVKKLENFNSRHFAHFYYINKMQSLYLWDEYEKAYEVSLISDIYLKDSPGMLHTAEHFFYKGLILACLIPGANRVNTLKWKRVLSSIVKKFKKYSEQSSSNFEHKYRLLAAELALIQGNLEKAQSEYYEALNSSEKYEYLQIQALINRRLFELHLKDGKKKIAAIHLSDAEYLYNLLGAKGIVDLMASKRSSSNFSRMEFRFGQRAEEKGVGQNFSNNDLDLKSVLKSSEAISKEIKLKDLLKILMKIIIENAGAQRMVLLLKTENEFTVQSESCTKNDEPNLFENLPLKSFKPIAKEVVLYALKNKESVILENAVQDNRFGKDPYILKEKLKSIMIVPLMKQSEVTGIIYLENNLIEGAFTIERLNLINILSSQMAISLENAMLYQNMEDKIRLRTKQLNEEKEKSEELLLNILPPEIASELKNNGMSKARNFNDVSVMFTDIVNFSGLCEVLTAEELVAELNYFYCEFDRIVDRYGIEKIKTVGDSYMCAGGLNFTKEFDASNIILAAFEINEFIQEHMKSKISEGKPPISMRIGIHTGPVIAGIVGIKKFAYDIWGDTVNVASRMETAGESGKINISGQTYELIKDKFNCTPRGKIKVKNKGQVEMYFVDSKI